MISSFGYDPNQFSNYHKVTGRAGLLDYVYIHKAYVQKRFLAKAQLAVKRTELERMDVCR